jgi:3-hydroxyisobutyrate dehydrogenase
VRDARIGFVGTGRMGRPMAILLARAGRTVTVFDRNPAVPAEIAAESSAKAASDLKTLGAASDVVIAMLPNGAVVRETLQVPGGILEGLAAGSLVIDMSSSSPTGTLELGEGLRARNIALVDAPVSGGVSRARSGKLTIMAGGSDADVDRARPILEAMGSVVKVGKLGAGHAVKALNNYVSSAGLAAACEAMLIGLKFGLDGETMLRIFNTSTGQNFATTNKMAQFVLSGTYGSGFAMNLLAKDVRTAARLAEDLHIEAPTLRHSAELWTKAEGILGNEADHTEMYRYLAEQNRERD